jgi:hypothetical protein
MIASLIRMIASLIRMIASLIRYACTLEWMPLLAERSLQVMLLLAAQLHPAFVRLWGNHIPKLLGYLHTSAPHLCAPDTAYGGGSFEAGVPAGTGSSAVSGTGSSTAASGVGGRYGPLADEWAKLCLHFLGDTLDATAHDGALTDSMGRVVGDRAVMGGSAVVGAGEAREAAPWVVQLGHETLVMLAGGGAFPRPLKAAALALLGPLLARTPLDEALPVRLRSMLAACNECGGGVSGAGVLGFRFLFASGPNSANSAYLPMGYPKADTATAISSVSAGPTRLSPFRFIDINIDAAREFRPLKRVYISDQQSFGSVRNDLDITRTRLLSTQPVRSLERLRVTITLENGEQPPETGRDHDFTLTVFSVQNEINLPSWLNQTFVL